MGVIRPPRRHPTPAPPPEIPLPPAPPPNTGGTVPSYDSGAGETIQRDMSMNISDTAENRCAPIIYGQVRFQPQVVHAEIVATFLHMVYLLSEGEIHSVVSVNVCGSEVYTQAKTWCTCIVRVGTVDQTEITEVPHADWSSSYPGRALLYIRLDLTAAEFTGGNPEVEVIVKGIKVYDPRIDDRVWTENPVLIARDLMTNGDYGAGLDSAFLDSDSWTEAMNICDEAVEGAGRWRASFMVTDRRPVVDVVRDLLKTTCAGFVYWVDGKWYARLDAVNVIGARPTDTIPVGVRTRAQTFKAPGVRIKVILKLDIDEDFEDPTLWLRMQPENLYGYATATGLSPGPNQLVTFDFLETGAYLVPGETWWLILKPHRGITWHQAQSNVYPDGSAYIGL